jgi:lantibiotic modifying enzyme
VAMQDPTKQAAASTMTIPGDLRAPSAQTLISTAARIGDRICELAIEDGDRCTWLVPEMVNLRRLGTSVAGFDLYDGLSGIALFLAQLGALTGEVRYSRMAEAAMREALALCRHQSVSSAKLGAFQGIGGLCYALVHLAAAAHRQDLAMEASAIIRKFASRATRTADLDLITGMAGFIVAALVVARFNQDGSLVETLRPAVERLYRFISAPRGRRPLSILSASDAGVAHGRAGVGLALLRWAETTGETRFWTAGEDLLRKDFAIIETTPPNPSAKTASDHPSDALGWCRGSIGVAMAALAAHPPVVNLFDGAWLTGVAQEIARSRPNRPLCLCHGALGWLEFLGFADRGLLGDDRVQCWRNALLGEIVGGRWVADWAHALESPSLMLGLAGTGYSLLRQAAGNCVPSVLTLENASSV